MSSFVQMVISQNELQLLGRVEKGRYTRCDLYYTILLYFYAEIREMIYKSVNLKEVVYN